MGNHPINAAAARPRPTGKSLIGTAFSSGLSLLKGRVRREAEARGSIAQDFDFDLNDARQKEPVPSLEKLEPETAEPLSAVEKLAEGFHLQLEMLHQSLGLTTAALLWIDRSQRNLHLRCLISDREDIQPGPFPLGSGITGALLGEQGEVALAPVKDHFPGLPYYRHSRGVGGLLALRLPTSGSEDQPPVALLCVDRESREPWSDSERQTLRLAARRLALDVEMARQMHRTDRERRAMRLACIGLRELNSALGLNSAFEATVRAIKALIAADFVGISLVENGAHRTVHADGRHADRLLGTEFPLDQGLVGQVLKFNCILPEDGDYRGHCPVFSQSHLFADYRSLFIVPLRKEQGAPIGVLTIAARKPRVFTPACREILELIATQVATKIDLARSHDQINRLATTDTLTGLGNQRAFRHGFELMLHRAKRRESPLCLVLCDVDHFKSVNDNYGHPFGDEVLKAVAAALADTVRVVDLAARYGGEEFAVILEDSDLENASQVAERLRQAVSAIGLSHGGKEVKVTMSLGVAAFPDHGEDIPTLIERADQALYQAKNSGRNRAICWQGPAA